MQLMVICIKNRCTFEYGLCDWYNEPGQSSLINWKQQSGPTITADTGPDRGHLFFWLKTPFNS